jgi:hypothetical protein
MENQFQALQNWTLEILETIKKDIKTDHLHTDPAFYRSYFGNRPQNRLTSDEIFAAYQKELLQGNESLAEWVVNRWVFKHGDLYHHFAENLSRINPDFSEIKELSEKESEEIVEGALQNFGAIQTYLFTVLNGVVLHKSVVGRLSKAADSEKTAQAKQIIEEEKRENLEKILASHAREIARLNDKITGVLKKYTTDTEALKKQIKALQAKLNGR